jgi:hypothetical protein
MLPRNAFVPPTQIICTFVATVFGKAEKMSMMSMPKAEKMSMPTEKIVSPFGKTVKMSVPKAEKMSMPKEKMSMPKADKTVDAKAEKMSMPKGKSTNSPSICLSLE